MWTEQSDQLSFVMNAAAADAAIAVLVAVVVDAAVAVAAAKSLRGRRCIRRRL